MRNVGEIGVALAILFSGCASNADIDWANSSDLGTRSNVVASNQSNELAGEANDGLPISPTTGDLSNLAKLANSMRPGEWLEINAQTCAASGVDCEGPHHLSDVFLEEYPPNVRGNTGPTSIISAWASGVWDGRRLYLSNGGHQDYFGNDVLAYDAEKLGFVRLTDPAPIIDFRGPTCHPESGPPPVHTYDGALWVPSLGEAWFAGAFSNCGKRGYFWAFNPQTLQWRETRVPEFGWGGTALHTNGMILVATGPSSCETRFRIIDPVAEKQAEIRAGWATGCQDVAEVSGGFFWVIGTYHPENLRLVATPLTETSLNTGRQVISDRIGINLYGTGMAAAPDGGVMLWAGDRETLAARVENGKILVRHFANASGPGPSRTENRAGVFGRWTYVPQAGVYLGLNHHTEHGVWLYKPPTE